MRKYLKNVVVWPTNNAMYENLLDRLKDECFISFKQKDKKFDSSLGIFFMDLEEGDTLYRMRFVKPESHAINNEIMDKVLLNGAYIGLVYSYGDELADKANSIMNKMKEHGVKEISLIKSPEGLVNKLSLRRITQKNGNTISEILLNMDDTIKRKFKKEYLKKYGKECPDTTIEALDLIVDEMLSNVRKYEEYVRETLIGYED